MNPGCPQKHRDQRQRNKTRADAEDQGDATNDLSRDREIGQKSRQAETLEKADGSGDGKDADLQPTMGEKERTARDAKSEGGIVGVRVRGHIRVLLLKAARGQPVCEGTYALRIMTKMANIANDRLQFVRNTHMDLFDQLRAFVATAQSGSFTGAASQLGMSNRLTSKYVAELEQRLGVRLFQRTTRKVGLTPAGADLLSRAPALLADLDDLLADVSDSSKGLSGVLRISAPITFGELYIAGMLARFSELHPGIAIDLRLSDAFSDLAAEGIDVAFRIGRFDMASLKVRRLGTFESLPVASPDYLARVGRPKTPNDLAEHSCIVDTNRRNPKRWAFEHNGIQVVAQIEGRFHVNSASAAVDLARRGLGIAYVPSFALSGALDRGELVRLLESYAGERGDVAAIYLEGRTLPQKVRALIDFAVLDFGTTRSI